MAASVAILINAGSADGYTYGAVINDTDNTNIYLGKSSASLSDFLLFQNAQIPQGSSITTAIIRHIVSASNSAISCDTIIYGNDTDNASAPTTVAAYWALPLTSAAVSWIIPAWETVGASKNSPDISPIIQEIVNRPSWASGNALQILEIDHNSNTNAQRLFTPFEASSTNCAKLIVHFELPSGNITVTPPIKSLKATPNTATVLNPVQIKPTIKSLKATPLTPNVTIATKIISAIKALVVTKNTPTILNTTPDFPGTGTLEVNIAFTNNPLDTSPSWSNMASYVREIHTSRGRNHELDRMESGTCDIVLNNTSGVFFPDYNDGTYYPNKDIMKRVNIRTFYSGAFREVFTGYIESYIPSFLGTGGYGSLMTLHCVGILGKIVSLQVLNNAGYAQESTGTRVDNVLNSCSIPAAWIDSDAGSDTVVSTGAVANVNALDHLQKVQETELGLLYEKSDGSIMYESRGHRGIAPHTSADAIFGEDGGSEIPYTSYAYSKDEVLLFNDTRITRSGGTEQVVSNASSQTVYGKRSFVRSTLHTTDGAAYLLGSFIAARYAFPTGRVESMTIIPDDSTKWTQCLTREISDRITFRNDAAGIDKDYFIESIVHDWDFVNWNFQTKFSLSDATRYLYQPDSITETFRPNAAGTYTQNVKNTASYNYECVDEVSQDSDTTYVYATTVSDGTYIDTYNLPDSAYGTGNIDSVSIHSWMRNAGAENYTPHGSIYFRTVSTNGDIDNVLTASYQEFVYSSSVNPVTSATWTWAQINDLQIGTKLQTNTAFNLHGRCTQVYAEVNFTPAW